MSANTRINKYDTLKGILIFLVLLGHIIGETGGGMVSKLTVFGIYAFHMPLFMTITGRFAKFKPFDALLYIALFFLFDAWFVVVTGVFYLLLPLFSRIKTRGAQLVTIGVTLILGLSAGFLPLGTDFEAPLRMITFLPYFLLGYYQVFEWRPVKHKIILGVILFAFTIFALPVIMKNVLVPLFMCDEYIYPMHFVQHRCIAYALGILWTWWILTVTTNKHIPVFTKLGASTLWIYLLHEPMLPMIIATFLKVLTRTTLPYFPFQLLIAVVWCLLLWPVAILAQKLTQKLLKYLRPLSDKIAAKCMPKT